MGSRASVIAAIAIAFAPAARSGIAQDQEPPSRLAQTIRSGPERGARPDRATLLRRFDRDGNGVLDSLERRAAYEALREVRGKLPQETPRETPKTTPRKTPDKHVQERGTRPDRRALLERFDADGDGRLDGAERLRLRAALQRRGHDLRAQVLRRFDANGDGKLDEAERGRAREALQRSERGRILRERLDANRDGRIDEAERARAREALERRARDPRRVPGTQGKGPRKRTQRAP